MLKTDYARWQDVPIAEFRQRWPDFSPQEIACKGTGKLKLNFDALDRLQKLRTLVGKPLILNSAYRSPEHNRAVGGASKSEHMQGIAFDVSMTNHNPIAFAAAAEQCGFKGFGHYPGSNFMHIDTAAKRYWKGTGKNNKFFFDPTKPAYGLLQSTPVPVFSAPVPETKLDKAKQLAPVALPALAGPLVAVADGNGPVQWAIGVVILIAVVAGLMFLWKRTRVDPA